MISIRKPDDFHLHLRQGEDLKGYLADSSRHFARALVMPNTVPPVNSPDSLRAYQNEIGAAMAGDSTFKPLYSYKITASISEDDLDAMISLGAVAGKYYPRGATTNAEDGVSDHRDIFGLFRLMEERDQVLCIHGEDPDAYVLDREKAFLPVLKEIRRNFPRLRIILEHISSRDGIEAVKNMDGPTAGTLTVHHLMRNLNDMLGNSINPHLFCKPLLKHPADQKALMDTAFSGDPRFFLGTDSAPHKRGSKESCCGSAGVYTAPLAVPALFQFFVENGMVSGSDAGLFEAFTSESGARFYGLPLNTERITLKKSPWTVPDEYNGVVPFLAGTGLEWSVE